MNQSIRRAHLAGKALPLWTERMNRLDRSMGTAKTQKEFDALLSRYLLAASLVTYWKAKAA